MYLARGMPHLTPAQLRVIGLVATAVCCGVAAIVPEPWSAILTLLGGAVGGWLGVKQPGQR